MKTQVFFQKTGTSSGKVLKRLVELKCLDADWERGKIFGFIFHPGKEYASVMETAYQAFLYESTLNPEAFQSLRIMENEAVSMARELLNGDRRVTGTMTSGGTESILMAMKVARDRAMDKNRLIHPEVVAPISAHPALDKAAHYLGIRMVHTPLREDMRADINAIQKALNKNTIMLIASAPTFPHGVIDPVEQIAEIALEQRLYCHVDACMGGFMLPFLEEAGFQIPAYDFRLPGVSSVSLDAHKYGYACKGASFILYRNAELRKKQFFISTEWPGGIFASSALLGTKSGGPIAAAWTIMKLMGRDGYRRNALKVMESTKCLIDGINDIDGLRVISNPEMSVFAVGSDNVNISRISAQMKKKGWHLDRLQFPNALHFTISTLHCGKEKELLADLKDVVRRVKRAYGKHITDKLIKSSAKSISAVLPEKQFRKLARLGEAFGNSSGPSENPAMYGFFSELKNSGNRKDIVMEIYDKLYSI